MPVARANEKTSKKGNSIHQLLFPLSDRHSKLETTSAVGIITHSAQLVISRAQ